jgi:2-polyprenyl-3-methyl-5-hydroxy-6-metoxy-1,4-benzoquinol methylase
MKMVIGTPRTCIYERDLSAGLTGKYRSVYDKIAAGSRVLEIGCSTGYFSRVLIRKNCEVIAVDNDPDAVRACEQRGIKAHHCDVGSTEFDNILSTHAPVDYVLAMDVLEHLAAPQLLVSALARGMQQKAKLIVTGPNVAYWHVRWRLLQGRWEYTEVGIMDKTHLRWFTRATWRKLLTENGFCIVTEAVAESMYPKEAQLRSAFGPGVIEATRRVGDRYLPNVFATVFIFECSPNSI